MRKTFGTVPILTGNQLPGPNRRGPAQFQGQLFLEHSSGNYYKALDAGPDVEYERVILRTASDDPVTVIEDPDYPGFAKLV